MGKRRLAIPATAKFHTCVRPRAHRFRLGAGMENFFPQGGIKRIPGAWVNRGHDGVWIDAPENAAGLVRWILDANKIPYEESVSGDQPKFTSVEQLLSPQLSDLARTRLRNTQYQLDGLLFTCRRGSSGLLWAPGGGKTLGYIAWALAEPEFRSLFVVKPSTRAQIKREIIKYTVFKEEDVFVCDGKTSSEIPSVAFVIIGWNLIADWLTRLIAWAPQNLVFDESHLGKQSRRQERIPLATPQEYKCRACGAQGPAETVVFEEKKVLFKPVQAVLGAPWTHVCGGSADPLPWKQKFEYKDTGGLVTAAEELSRKSIRRLIATATPKADRPRDLWAQFDLAQPNQWGHYSAFCSAYAGAKETEFGWNDKGDPSDAMLRELRARMLDAFHIVPEEVTRAGLPKTRHEVIYLPRDQQDNTSGDWKKEQRFARGNPSAEFELELMRAASRKRNYVVERVVEAVKAKQKVIVWTGRVKDTERLAAAIAGKAPKDVGVMWATAETHSDKERDGMVRRYAENKDEPMVLVATGQSMGEGLDGLQCTDLMLMCMLPWTSKDVEQWVGRGIRLGQDRAMLVSWIICTHSVDTHVANIIIKKLEENAILMGKTKDADLAKQLEGLQDREGVLRAMVERMSKKRDWEVDG